MLFVGWEIGIVKNCDRGRLEIAPGRRAAFSSPRSQVVCHLSIKQMFPKFTEYRPAGLESVDLHVSSKTSVFGGNITSGNTKSLI